MSGMETWVEILAEARTWGWRFAHDCRAVKSRTHVHECGPSCWQYNEPGSRVRICRHDFQETVRLARFDDLAKKVRYTTVLRRGKGLVPQIRVLEEGLRGRRGRVDPVRVMPFEGPSTVGNVICRSNVDLRSMARVPGRSDAREHLVREAVLRCLREHSEAQGLCFSWPTLADLAGEAASQLDDGPEPEADTNDGRAELERRCLVEDLVDKWANAGIPLTSAADGCSFTLQLKVPRGTSTVGGRRVHLLAASSDGPVSREEAARREVESNILDGWRDGQDQSYYTGEYSTKPNKTLEPILARQEPAAGLARHSARDKRERHEFEVGR